MNVRVSYSEEIQNIQPPVTQRYRGSQYIKQNVTGTVDIINQRNEDVTLHLKSEWIGEAENNIEPAPSSQSHSSKNRLPNGSTGLFWELQLKAGEKKTITLSGTRWVQ
jgi:hypothetical protein